MNELYELNFSYTTCKDFGYCLYYSIVTFTTLGYGDIHPLGYSHIIASVEALTGAFFIALFVVVFARKMMR
ncbi:MAG: two pore domain potassium channel family protein [Theionarchaea archaeon]|nr:two pore domain potassium channel family protein [Theionarchaea archaeon]